MASEASEEREPRPPEEQLSFIRDETRFELGLLHERVNALVTAEAFLTIAYTTAMSNTAPWGATFSRVAAPILSGLGLVLAVLAWPGVDGTVRIILAWSARRGELLERHPELWVLHWKPGPRSSDARRAGLDSWRSMLFFRAVPGLFVIVWAVLTVLALTLRR